LILSNNNYKRTTRVQKFIVLEEDKIKEDYKRRVTRYT
jgi:hypothetical protein